MADCEAWVCVRNAWVHGDVFWRCNPPADGDHPSSPAVVDEPSLRVTVVAPGPDEPVIVERAR